MQEEMDSLLTNETWELAQLPAQKKVLHNKYEVLHNKWVYWVKQEIDGSKRFNARLVVKGF